MAEDLPQSNLSLPLSEEGGTLRDKENAMLDVHPPHAAAHSWRDIFIHLATITVGLFIALSLEAGLERLHNRHIVAEARENIRMEITQNEKLLAADIRSVESDKRQMQADMNALRSLRADPKAHASMTLAFSWSSLNSSAWLTARDTGALSHMNYANVQNYAEVYGQQELVNEAARDLFRNQTSAIVPLLIEAPGADFTPAQLDEALHRCAELYVRLETLQDLIKGLSSSYGEALKSP